MATRTRKTAVPVMSKTDHWTTAATAAREYAVEDTTAADEARAARASRAEFISNLRALADLLEQHPELPRPYNASMTVYVDYDEARAGRQGIPGWHKYNTEKASYITYSKTFGAGTGEGWHADTVTLALEVSKSGTCTRVQTGTQHIPAQEATDVPVYKWEC